MCGWGRGTPRTRSVNTAATPVPWLSFPSRTLQQACSHRPARELYGPSRIGERARLVGRRFDVMVLPHLPNHHTRNRLSALIDHLDAPRRHHGGREREQDGYGHEDDCAPPPPSPEEEIIAQGGGWRVLRVCVPSAEAAQSGRSGLAHNPGGQSRRAAPAVPSIAHWPAGSVLDGAVLSSARNRPSALERAYRGRLGA